MLALIGHIIIIIGKACATLLALCFVTFLAAAYIDVKTHKYDDIDNTYEEECNDEEGMNDYE